MSTFRNHCYMCKGCANHVAARTRKPLEALLPGALMVEAMGIEPTTPCLQSRRSTSPHAGNIGSELVQRRSRTYPGRPLLTAGHRLYMCTKCAK